MRLHRRIIMPRKTKELKNEKKPENKLESVIIKNKKVTTTKKNSTKETTTKKKALASNAKKKAKNTTKKSKTKKATSQKTSRKKTTSSTEYYDLPYRYNQTIVRVLAQTPTTLFIYWDISDNDRKNLEKQYGLNFFETTRPILIVYNDTLGYHFEVAINDFANSWYLQVADSKCDYRIELGRRPIAQTKKINTDYIYITTSNKIEAPNDRILFNDKQKMVYFKDLKTGKQTTKAISSISFIRNMGKFYNIYDFYQTIYQNENIEEMYDLANPSSGNPSSGSLSSKFK